MTLSYVQGLRLFLDAVQFDAALRNINLSAQIRTKHFRSSVAFTPNVLDRRCRGAKKALKHELIHPTKMYNGIGLTTPRGRCVSAPISVF